jgi:hypothetical protein
MRSKTCRAFICFAITSDSYQEELVSLDELRSRMPELHRQQQALQDELQSLQMAAQDRSRYLRFVAEPQSVS